MHNVITVARMPPSIVISNMMIRLGHQATIGMLPVTSGHARSVMVVSQIATSRPMKPPTPAIACIHVALSRWLNSYSSIGSADMTVMSRSATPAARRPLTARCAASGSAYNA